MGKNVSDHDYHWVVYMACQSTIAFGIDSDVTVLAPIHAPGVFNCPGVYAVEAYKQGCVIVVDHVRTAQHSPQI